MLPVVLAITLVAAIAFIMNYESTSETHTVGSELQTDQARYVAEAALNHGQWQLEQAGCGPYTNIAGQTFAKHSYSVTITPNNAGGQITTNMVAVSDDAWISSETGTQNYGSDAQLTSNFRLSPFAQKHSLYRFDIENAGIPADAVVISAEAKIFVLNPEAASVHKITADWSEGTVNWDSISSSFDLSPIAFIASSSPAGEYVSVNITTLVQGWISGATANQGIMLISNGIEQLGEYTSKEYGNTAQRPQLELKITDGTLSNRADISATGTLANGVSRTANRIDIPLYQPTISYVWQPEDELADAFIWDGAHKNKNFGISPILNIKNDRNVLIRFALEALPPGARVSDAKLELYLEAGSGVVDGVLDLHAIDRSWVEGIFDDQTPGSAAGVTYWDYDGSESWTTPGGDYNSAIIDSITLPSMIPGWYEWNVTSQIQSWLDGEPNYGFLLREGGGDAGDIDFVSSDNTTTPEFHPRLSITLACECGISCLLPQGSGNVLMVVTNEWGMTSDEVEKKALFESWGYTVTLISQWDVDWYFDNLAVNNDVAYVSASIDETTWGLAPKLAATHIGVVNEEGAYTDELGISTGYAYTVGKEMQVLDNSHYITSLFPAGVMPIYSANMEALQTTGTPAADLQTLGNFNSAPGLSVIDTGGLLAGGGNAAGRRVTIPIGRSANFNWDYLNNNGRLIVQRALEWGVGAVDAPALLPIAHWKLDDALGTVALDSEGGHNGTLLNGPIWTAGQVDGALDFDGNNDAIRVPHNDALSLTETLTFTAWINPDAIGARYNTILAKDGDGANSNYWFGLWQDELAFGFFSGGTFREVFTSGVNIQAGNWQHIAVSFDNSSDQVLFYLGGTPVHKGMLSFTPTAVTTDLGIARSPDGEYWNGLLDDIRIYDQVLAATDISSLSTGSSVTEPPPPSSSCDGDYLEQFDNLNFSGNNGSLNWSGDWVEVGESDGAAMGDVQIMEDDNGDGHRYRLHIGNKDNGVEREADLSGAAKVLLSFDYRRMGLDNTIDYVAVYASSTGTAGPWTELPAPRIEGRGTDSLYQSYSRDISAYISTNTAIRLRSSSKMGKDDTVWFDNLQISCSP